MDTELASPALRWAIKADVPAVALDDVRALIEAERDRFAKYDRSDPRMVVRPSQIKLLDRLLAALSDPDTEP